MSRCEHLPNASRIVLIALALILYGCDRGDGPEPAGPLLLTVDYATHHWPWQIRLRNDGSQAAQGIEIHFGMVVTLRVTESGETVDILAPPHPRAAPAPPGPTTYTIDSLAPGATAQIIAWGGVQQDADAARRVRATMAGAAVETQYREIPAPPAVTVTGHSPAPQAR